MFDFAILFLLALIACIVAAAVGQRLGGRRMSGILVLGVLARLLGSTLRVEVAERVYNRVGDAYVYFAYGARYSGQLLSGDFALFSDYTGRWWGSVFIRWVTGLVMVVTGQHYRAVMFAFSMFSFVGLVLIACAYSNALQRRADTFTVAVALWPSLCFWPASIGKDTLMILALGLTTYGFVGRSERIRLVPLVFGFALAACIRPHVAGALVAAAGFAEWARLDRRRGRGTAALLFAVVAGAAVTVYSGLTQLTGGDLDLESVREQIEFRSTQTQSGGSAISIARGLSSIPMAFVNVLLRPFPWEAHHIFALFASLEVWTMWALVLARRREALRIVRSWRSSRLVAFAIPTVLMITLLYGVAFSNLGIIARQRVIILPFVFVLIALTRTRGTAGAVVS